MIWKKGNSELRYALYQAANIAAARVDLFREYFTKLLRGREHERGIKTNRKRRADTEPEYRRDLHRPPGLRFGEPMPRRTRF